MNTPQPNPAVAGRRAYGVPRDDAPIDLYLDGNEGAGPGAAVLSELGAAVAERIRRYPTTSALTGAFAARLGVSPDQVLVTAGGDDAIDRACRAVMGPGAEMIAPAPGFEMFGRYGALAGGVVVEPRWFDGPFPTEDVIGRINDSTRVIAIVSPNNPTGLTAVASDVRRISAHARRALVVLDLAYVEFADEDVSSMALTLPNVVIIRTMSKAWGLAGLRVGYAAGPAEIIGWLRVAGGPYTVSGLSAAIALHRLEHGEADVLRFVRAVRDERIRLANQWRELGASPWPSQGNFVLARVPDATELRRRMAMTGIAIRTFPGSPHVGDCVRITCPGNDAHFARLEAALTAAMGGAT